MRAAPLLLLPRNKHACVESQRATHLISENQNIEKCQSASLSFSSICITACIDISGRLLDAALKGQNLLQTPLEHGQGRQNLGHCMRRQGP